MLSIMKEVQTDSLHLFITGGTGFFGKALLRYWATNHLPELAGARFTLLSRDPTRFREQHGDLLKGLDIKLIAGDVLRPETLPRGDYTHLIHAAADSTTGLSLTPLQRFSQIVDGTRNVLDLAVHSGNPRVLMTSSGGVYGAIEHFRNGVPEYFCGIPDPSNPQNAYSVAKRQAEHLCALYLDAYGLQSVIARCFAFVGEDLPLDAHFAIGNFIRDVLAGHDIKIQGDGTPVRSYMDQRDLARWLTTLLLHAESGRSYNVGSPEAVSIMQLAERIAAAAPFHRPRIHRMKRPAQGQAANRNFYLPDISLAHDELGLQLEFDLETSIRDCIDKLKTR